MTKYRGAREVSPAQYLFSQAEHVLKGAEATEEGRKLECMVAITLAAFSMEAFLNLVGEQVFAEKYGQKSGHKKWERLERSLGALAKVDLLVEMKSLPVDTSKEPYTLLEPLFKYRNALAHGKTWRSKEVVFESAYSPPRLADMPELNPPWFTAATPRQARKYVDAVRRIADDLVLRGGFLQGLHASDLGWYEEVFTDAGNA